MILPDVNVLLFAFRDDVDDHARYRAWLLEEVTAPRAFAVSEMVLSAFVRIVTHPRIFKTPTPAREAFAFVESLRSRSQCVCITPGRRHWDIFSELCRKTNASGNLVPDAYLAALAIESACEWITTDGDFARFPGLSWRHPLG